MIGMICFVAAVAGTFLHSFFDISDDDLFVMHLSQRFKITAGPQRVSALDGQALASDLKNDESKSLISANDEGLTSIMKRSELIGDCVRNYSVIIILNPKF